VNGWLETLFDQGMRSLEEFDGIGTGASNTETSGASAQQEQDRATLAINVIALFNLVTGYFLSQRAFDSLAQGELIDPDNIARQKRLLHKVIRAMLIS
jgi:hypothetical protein